VLSSTGMPPPRVPGWLVPVERGAGGWVAASRGPPILAPPGRPIRGAGPLRPPSGMIGPVAQVISSPVLVGRTAELARLGPAREGAATGEPVAVVVAGEAGMGKTRLVTEFAAQA